MANEPYRGRILFPNIRGHVSAGTPAGRPDRVPDEPAPTYGPFPAEMPPPEMQGVEVPGRESPWVTGISTLMGSIGAALVNNPMLLNSMIENMRAREDERQEALRANVALSNQQRLEAYKAKKEYTFDIYGEQSRRAEAEAGRVGRNVEAEYKAEMADVAEQRRQYEWGVETGLERQRIAARGGETPGAMTDRDMAAVVDLAGFQQRADAMLLGGGDNTIGLMQAAEAPPEMASKGINFVDPVMKNAPVRLPNPALAYQVLENWRAQTLPENKAAVDAVFNRTIPWINKTMRAAGLEVPENYAAIEAAGGAGPVIETPPPPPAPPVQPKESFGDWMNKTLPWPPPTSSASPVGKGIEAGLSAGQRLIQGRKQAAQGNVAVKRHDEMAAVERQLNEITQAATAMADTIGQVQNAPAQRLTPNSPPLAKIARQGWRIQRGELEIRLRPDPPEEGDWASFLEDLATEAALARQSLVAKREKLEAQYGYVPRAAQGGWVTK